MASSKFRFIKRTANPDLEYDEDGNPIYNGEPGEPNIDPEAKFDAEQRAIAGNDPKLQTLAQKFAKEREVMKRKPVEHRGGPRGDEELDTEEWRKKEIERTKPPEPLKVVVNGKAPEPKKPDTFEVSGGPVDTGTTGDKQAVSTPPPNQSNPYKFNNGQEYINDLKKRMDDLDSATKLSERRNLALGMTSGSMNIPANGQQFRAAFSDYANYPVQSVKEAADIRGKGLANDKAEFDQLDRIQMADPNSEVSKAYRKQVNRILKAEGDDVLAETVSALDIQKMFPSIKIDVVDTGQTIRQDSKNKTQLEVEAQRRAGALERLNQNIKARMAELDSRNQNRLAVQGLANQGGVNKAIVSGTLSQRQSTSTGGSGGGGSNRYGDQTSGYTLSVPTKLAERGILGLVPKNPSIMPKKDDFKNVIEAGHWAGQLDVGFDAVLDIYREIGDHPTNLTTEEWGSLQSALTTTMEAMTKANKNGVMNKGDYENATAAIQGFRSSPEQFVQWVRGEFPTIAARSWALFGKKYLEAVATAGFKPTDSQEELDMWFKKSPLGQAGSGGPGGGARQSSSGPVNIPSADAVNEAAGRKLIEPKAPVQDTPPIPPKQTTAPAVAPTQNKPKTVFVRDPVTGLLVKKVK